MKHEDVLLNVFPYAPHLAFWQTFWGGYQVGVTALQTGGGKILGTEKIGLAAQLMKASVMAVMPGYAYHLLRSMAEQKRDLSSLRFCVFGGERVPPGLRKKVKSLLTEMGAKDPRVLATYAFTECRTAWGECDEAGSGYHTYPDYELIEIVDPRTGEPVGEGERGEIVYSALDWRGSCVLRYRTGDIAAKGITYEPCPSCGRTVPRVDSNITRSSEVKEFHLDKVKGSLVDLNAFFPMLSGMPGVLEWQVELRKHGDDPLDLDEVVVHVATLPGSDWSGIERQVREEMVRTVEIAPNQVRRRELADLLVSLGMETELKEKRILDNRPK
jgi:phenylacetate-coenzyme A ligase PaaK-like adenylate-forming protein